MEIKELEKVVFQKGDIFVLKLGRVVSKEAVDRIKDMVDQGLVKTGLESGDVTILVFEEKVELEIWRSNQKSKGFAETR